MKILPLPPLELLKERFYVSEDSPSGLRYKADVYHTRARKDAVAGYCQQRGYWTVRINGQAYFAHRIAYYLINGEDPGNYSIDHKQGLSQPLSLRQATHAQNMCNRPAQINCRSGVKGVRAAKRKGRWEARICKDGKQIHIGTFDTLKEASDAYDRKAFELNGEFATLNNFVE